jgi:NTP pyrophosphatase (non-canonical NTP hydrolase)
MPTHPDKYQRMLQMQENWLKDRPSMQANNTATALGFLLMHEAVELTEELANGCDPEKLQSEAADVGIFLIAFFQVLGVDMYEAIAQKTAFNHARYNAVDFQKPGSYMEARRKGKQRAPDVKRDFGYA